jgi:multicomponent Na+:H+ antiporter subunit B
MKSLILETATRLIVGLMLMFSIFLLLRGHDEPGGGFVGGLVASTAFVVYALSHGPGAVRGALRFDPRAIAMVGLGCALLAGVIALAVGQDFLTGVWAKTKIAEDVVLPLGTPLLFDIGVYLVVVGSVLAMILALEEEE